MGRRSRWHDYCSRCIYMVTLEVVGHRRLLCEVSGTPEAPVVTPTALGAAVLVACGEIGAHYPWVRVMASQLMPDHIHLVLFFAEQTDVHLGRVVNGLKIAGNKAYRGLGLWSEDYPGLWAPKYNDQILRGEGQLARMLNYVADNPRRLLMRRLSPDLFKVRHKVVVGEHELEAQGNVFLLGRPWLVAVRVSRKVASNDDIATVVGEYLEKARGGAVLVSPSISRGEKAVMRAAFDAGLPTILVRDSGFGERSKPSGQAFEACAAGRLLQVSPWEYTTRRVTLDRDRCLLMNDVAAAIAAGHDG